MADQHSEPVPSGLDGRTEEPARTRMTAHRPGILIFAAVIMFVVAGLEFLSALLSFAGTGWWTTSTGDLIYTNFVFWGVLDGITALAALYAGIDLLRGGAFGLVMGYLFAGLTAVRWLIVIPASPVVAVVVIALCVMVIYGLAKSSEYSASA